MHWLPVLTYHQIHEMRATEALIMILSFCSNGPNLLVAFRLFQLSYLFLIRES